MKSKIALGMIVKDDSEIPSLKRCLDSVAPYVDGIYITATQKPYKKLQKLANEYGINIDIRAGEFNHLITKKEVQWLIETFKDYPNFKLKLKEGDVIFQFDKARNANLDFIPDEYDWFFWIDADDILLDGVHLRTTADNALAQNWEAIFFNYIYQAELDSNGKIKNIIIQHLRERLVRFNGEYRKVWKWVGNIHETLIQQRETRKANEESVTVLHLSDSERFQKALKRNMRVLEYNIYKTKGKDPRPFYYLGKAYYDLHTPEAYEIAKKLINVYLSPEGHQSNMSGWKEERAQAWEYLSEIYRAQGQLNNSIKSSMNSLVEYPEFPSVYFGLGITYLMKQEFDRARFWAILGSKVPPAKTTLVSTPRDIESRAYEVIYNAGINTNRIDEAWAACQRLTELYPEDEKIQQQWQFINQTREIRDTLKNYAQTINFLTKTGQQDKLRPLLASAPNEIRDNPYLVKFWQELYPPKQWNEKEVAIYCGAQFTPWSPDSIASGKEFVGGSEEAVIYLSRELTKLGWKVVVFADPVKEGVYDGVEYLAHYKFNTRDTFNILVYWRAVSWMDMDCSAKQTYLWTHDVQNPVEYTKERLDKLTKIFVLSQAHRENLPEVPDDKFIISSNGYFEHYPKQKPKNNPKWCIWTSSYDRGLQNLLEIWPDVIKEVPDAQLHIFYGWQLFRHFYRGNPERMAWMQKVEDLMKQKGIVDHGRVSQPEVEEWYKRCGIWAYPTHFYEINCISAIKAQLWGAVPVTTDFAALKETVQHGKKVKGEILENFGLSPQLTKRYTKELIAALKDKDWQQQQRKKMMPWARKKYHWKEIAKQWNQEFMKLILKENE